MILIVDSLSIECYMELKEQKPSEGVDDLNHNRYSTNVLLGCHAECIEPLFWFGRIGPWI